jgi:electron transfer flavoprotein beta subunit
VRILVCVRRVPSPGARIVLTDDARAIDTRHLGFTVSPHEECAVEEAVQIVERHGGSSTVLTLGPAEAEDQLRTAVSMGIDHGVLLPTDTTDVDPRATAHAIADAIRALESEDAPFDLVLFGNESADAANHQVGIRVAHALGRPVVSGVKQIDLTDDRATMHRSVPDGFEVCDLPLPAVAAVREGLNLPRYPAMRGRLLAKKAEIRHLPPTLPAGGLRIMRPSSSRPASAQTVVLGHGARGRGRSWTSSRRWGCCERRARAAELTDGVLTRLSAETLTFARSLAAAHGGTSTPQSSATSTRRAPADLGAQGCRDVHTALLPIASTDAPAAWARPSPSCVARRSDRGRRPGHRPRRRGHGARRRPPRPAAGGQLRRGGTSRHRMDAHPGCAGAASCSRTPPRGRPWPCSRSPPTRPRRATRRTPPPSRCARRGRARRRDCSSRVSGRRASRGDGIRSRDRTGRDLRGTRGRERGGLRRPRGTRRTGRRCGRLLPRRDQQRVAVPQRPGRADRDAGRARPVRRVRHQRGDPALGRLHVSKKILAINTDPEAPMVTRATTR